LIRRCLIACFYLVASFQIGAAWGQARQPHPFDGMSAIDIAVAARLKKGKPVPHSVATAFDTPSGVVSSVDFFKFDIVELKGRPLHQGELPIPGDPIPGNVIALAELHGPWVTAQFRLVTGADELIENITMNLPDGQTSGVDLLGNFDVPNQPFKVAVSGEDTDGTPFDITRTHVYRPQTVEVRFSPEFQNVEPGIAELSAEITNHGPTETFQISVEDNIGAGVSSDVSEVELAQDESSQIVVTLQVPMISSGVLDIKINATATGKTNSSIQNSGKTTARLERFELVIKDGFED